jgi:hypothetical protein
MAQNDYRLTPFSTIEEDATPIAILPDTYTRLEVTSSGSGVVKDALEYTKRKAFWRLTIGKRYTTNVSLKATANRFVATVPLLTTDHESSSKQGESFTRTHLRTTFDFPLFLVRSDAAGDVASFEFLVNASDGTQSGGTSLALGAAERLLKTVAPTAGVLTTLSEDRTRELAGAIDSTVSALFSSTVSERQRFDINLRSGKAYKLEVFGPEQEGKLENLRRRLGSWRIAFAEPRPSVFSQVRVCANPADEGCRPTLSSARQEAARDAMSRPLSVLAFKLVGEAQELGTIGSYLKQQGWWTEDVTELQAGSATDNRADKARLFCRRIRSAIVSIGLNDLDGRIVSQAVANSDLVPRAVVSAMMDPAVMADCSAQGAA